MTFTTRMMLAAIAASVCVGTVYAEDVNVAGRILGADSGEPLPIETWIIGRNVSTGEWTRAALSKRGEDTYRLELPATGRYALYPLYGSFWYDDFKPRELIDISEKALEFDAEAASTEQDLTLPDPVLIRMRVVDASGQPLKNARACLSRISREYEYDFGALSLCRETDSEGQCEWFAVPGHEVWVNASIDGYTWKASDHFEIKPGDKIPEITLTLRKPGTITGNLVDVNGQPRPNTGFRLSVHDLQGANLKNRWANTDTTGRFVAHDFLVRDELRISLFSSSKHTPDWTMNYEGPADQDLAIGSVSVPDPAPAP